MLLLCICFAPFRSLPYGETQILLLLMREAEAIKSMSYERSRTESEDETLAKGRSWREEEQSTTPKPELRKFDLLSFPAVIGNFTKSQRIQSQHGWWRVIL